MKINLLFLLSLLTMPLAMAQARVPQAVAQTSVAAAAQADDKKFDIYPNPSTGIVQLLLKGFGMKKTEIRVSNVIGNLVHKEVVQEPEQSYVRVLDLSRFAKGVYFIKLEADEFSEVRKVVIK